MDPLITGVIQALPNFAFAALGYWLGWRIYQDSQKRIDYLISVIVSMCSPAEAQDVLDALKK